MNEPVVKKYDLSILIPFFNEEENLADNYHNIKAVLATLKESAEIIYVNDGSTDGGLKVLKTIAATDPQVKIVSFYRNFGQTAAMAAGFQAAAGRIYITLDADNQNDPRDIPHLLKKLDEGFDVVSGWRQKRQDDFILRRLPSILANWLISKVTKVPLKDYGCTLKAYRAEYIDNINLYGEMHRFIPAYAKYAGARVTEIVVNHHPRTKGISKYGLERILKVILDLLTVKYLGDYATKPIYFFGGLGFAFMSSAVLIAAFVLYEKFFLDIFVHRNPLFILSIFIFMLGVLMVMMGLIAELIMRTYYESQNKAIYVIKEKIGF
jgi:glycosyltransferase involved in cell wall biosynthesis